MDTRSNESFVVGVVLGASVAALAAVVMMTFDWRAGFVGWLERWQTLATGFMALGGALITVWWIQKQIDQARQQELERRERQNYADRAALPAALADLVGYAEAALVALKEIPQAQGKTALIKVPESWRAPTLSSVPSGAVSVLKACIETADYGSRKEMKKLLADLQVYNSRLKGLLEDLPTDRRIVTSSNMHEYLCNFLEVYLRCDRMIRYAREEHPTGLVVDIKLGDMTTRAIHMDLESYPGLMDAIVRRHESA